MTVDKNIEFLKLGAVFGILTLCALIAFSFGLLFSLYIYVIWLIYALIKYDALRGMKSLLVLFLLLLYSSLIFSDPVTDWDARSIWFFHGKRMFVDGTLFSQLDHYADWSHNDYPPLISFLAAISANTLGFWNEVFPRVGVLFVLAPALFFSIAIFSTFSGLLFWLVSIFSVVSIFLLNGYADGLLAIYAVLALLMLGEFSPVHKAPADRVSANSAKEWALLVLLAHILLLKNEGILIWGLLAVIYLPLIRTRKILLIPFLVSLLLYVLLWKAHLMLSSVGNDLLANGGALDRILSRFQSGDFKMILEEGVMVIGPYLWAYIAVILLLVFGRLRWILFSGVLFLLFYLTAIFAVYLSTYHDLAWHLSTSIDRTLMLPSLLALGLFVYYFDHFFSARLGEQNLD